MHVVRCFSSQWYRFLKTDIDQSVKLVNQLCAEKTRVRPNWIVITMCRISRLRKKFWKKAAKLITSSNTHHMKKKTSLNKLIFPPTLDVISVLNFITNIRFFSFSFLHVALYKMLFFDFWFRPPNGQNLLPKIEMWVIESVSLLVNEIWARRGVQSPTSLSTLFSLDGARLWYGGPRLVSNLRS